MHLILDQSTTKCGYTTVDVIDKTAYIMQYGYIKLPDSLDYDHRILILLHKIKEELLNCYKIENAVIENIQPQKFPKKVGTQTIMVFEHSTFQVLAELTGALKYFFAFEEINLEKAVPVRTVRANKKLKKYLNETKLDKDLIHKLYKEIFDKAFPNDVSDSLAMTYYYLLELLDVEEIVITKSQYKIIK